MTKFVISRKYSNMLHNLYRIIFYFSYSFLQSLHPKKWTKYTWILRLWNPLTVSQRKQEKRLEISKVAKIMSFRELKNVDKRSKDAVNGWIRNEKKLQNISSMVKAICILYYREFEKFHKVVNRKLKIFFKIFLRI